MAYEQILTEQRGRVGIIRLNRPEKLNAWTSQMGAEIVDQVQAWNRDASIGAILVTGEGRAFCAGADLGGFSERVKVNREGEGEQIARGGASITNILRQSKPTIAAVNGYSVGVGLTMILPCDVRIASTSARFSVRFIKMGLVPELGSTRLLAQIVGLGNATEMSLTGRMVDADEALRMGLVTAVATPETLMDIALAKAEEIANNPTVAVMMIKELLGKNPLDPDLDGVMEREGLRDQILRRQPDHAEAVAAFMEKRDPQFNKS
jgi:enoyl-CoA hydratase/carnithine racemase